MSNAIHAYDRVPSLLDAMERDAQWCLRRFKRSFIAPLGDPLNILPTDPVQVLDANALLVCVLTIRRDIRDKLYEQAICESFRAGRIHTLLMGRLTAAQAKAAAMARSSGGKESAAVKKRQAEKSRAEIVIAAKKHLIKLGGSGEVAKRAIFYSVVAQQVNVSKRTVEKALRDFWPKSSAKC